MAGSGRFEQLLQAAAKASQALAADEKARAIEDGIYNVECQLYAAKADLEASEPQQQPAKPVLQLKILAWSCAEEPAEQSLTDQQDAMEAYKPPAPAPQAAPDADAVPDDSPAAEFDLARRSAARPQMPTFPSLLYVAQLQFGGGTCKKETRIHRMARKVLNFMYFGHACGKLTLPTQESIIRGLCGDTPDVSKAMRLLVSCKLLAKTGRGGRLTPFVYKIPQDVVHKLQSSRICSSLEDCSPPSSAETQQLVSTGMMNLQQAGTSGASTTSSIPTPLQTKDCKAVPTPALTLGAGKQPGPPPSPQPLPHPTPLSPRYGLKTPPPLQLHSPTASWQGSAQRCPPCKRRLPSCNSDPPKKRRSGSMVPWGKENIWPGPYSC